MNQTEIKIPKHKLKQIGLFLASLAFVYVGNKMINGAFRSSRMSPESVNFWGYIGIAFFGLAGLLIFFDMLKSKPALILKTEGIINNSHFGGGYLIRWGNIKSLRIISINKQRMIEVDLKDDDEIFRQVNFIARQWMKVNERFMGTPTFIPAVMIKMNLDEVLSLIREQKKLNKNTKDV
ncbi:MAG: hypothetical protein KKH44_10450 [Bacteroidetes bacterium]|nr:hypothetical protein [Bacteroidota bacterium]